MSAALDFFDSYGVAYHKEIISAHRTPNRVLDFSAAAEGEGFKVLIAGAGGAAHLPGMVAAHTILPVIGVPIPTKNLGGMDSLYSIVQMPAGVPVATVSIGGAENAAILALQILGTSNSDIAEQLRHLKDRLVDKVGVMNEVLNAQAVDLKQSESQVPEGQ